MIAVIIQARIASTRLPGKVMMDINGKPMLLRLIERLKSCGLDIVIATSTDPSNEPLFELAKEHKFPIFAVDNENDVLNRYYQVASKLKLNTIVRITSDCPLIDPKVLTHVIQVYTINHCNYCSNVIERTYPDGLDCEVFSFKALEKVWKEAKDPYDREHVTPYILRNPDKFKLLSVENETDLSHLRWTVDTAEDLKFARWVYGKLGDNFYMEDVLKLGGRWKLK